MPNHLSIVKAGEFIRCDPQGTINFAESKRVLASLARAMVDRGVDRAILDVRVVHGDPPPTYLQLYELARTMREAGFDDSDRLAVLTSPDRIDRASFFATFASGSQWNCFAFDRFEEAFDWISDASEIPQR